MITWGGWAISETPLRWQAASGITKVVRNHGLWSRKGRPGGTWRWYNRKMGAVGLIHRGGRGRSWRNIGLVSRRHRWKTILFSPLGLWVITSALGSLHAILCILKQMIYAMNSVNFFICIYFFLKKIKCSFVWPHWVLVAAHEIFSWGMGHLVAWKLKC